MPRYQDVTIEQIRRALPQEVPAGVAAIIRNYYDRDPITFNTDWAGTMSTVEAFRKFGIMWHHE